MLEDFTVEEQESLLPRQKLRFGDPKLRVLLVVVYGASFSVNFLVSVVAPFFPQYAQEHCSISVTTTGVILAIFPLVSALCSPLTAKLITRIGRFPCVFAGLLILTTGLVLFGMSSTTWMFMGTRVMQGLGASFLWVSVNSLLIRNVENLEDAMSLSEVISGLGFIIAPPLGGILYQVSGFARLFQVLACLPTLVFLLLVAGYLRSPETWKGFDSRLNHEDADHVSICSRTILNRTVLLTGFSCLMCMFMLGFLNSTFGIHLETVFDTSSGIVGVIFAIPAASYVLCAATVGYVIRKLGYKRTMCLGIIMEAIGLIAMGPPPWISAYFTSAIPVWILTGFASLCLGVGLSFTFIPTLPLMRTTVPVDDEAENNRLAGFFGFSLSLGEFMGPIVGGFLFDHVEQTPEVLCKGSLCRTGWQYCTIILGSFLLLNWIVCQLFLKNSYPPEQPVVHE